MSDTSRIIDEYLDALPSADRESLQRIRDLVHGIVPGVEEVISHGIPAFRTKGIMVCGIAADDSGCWYVPFSASVLTEMHAQLVGYRIEQGAIRFRAERPLSRVLVRTLIQTRIRQATQRARQERSNAYGEDGDDHPGGIDRSRVPGRPRPE